MNSESGMRLALDARPLAQDPRTTAHRIASQLFPRLIKLAPFIPWSDDAGTADVSVALADGGSETARSGVPQAIQPPC